MTTRLPLDRVYPNPENIRSQLRDLEELTESVSAVGVLQPLLVTPAADGRLVLLDGHRRYEAAKRAGAKTVPVIAKRVRDDVDQVVVMLAAGLHDQLTPLEEARAFATLKARGLSFQDIARRTGRSAGTVRDRLVLLRLPERAQ
jgi:ParB family chromosome partitioning protein